MVETPKKRVPYHPSHFAIKEKMIDGLLLTLYLATTMIDQLLLITLYLATTICLHKLFSSSRNLHNHLPDNALFVCLRGLRPRPPHFLWFAHSIPVHQMKFHLRITPLPEKIPLKPLNAINNLSWAQKDKHIIHWQVC